MIVRGYGSEDLVTRLEMVVSMRGIDKKFLRAADVQR